MTKREKMIRALHCQPITGHVPHFELVYFLTMEKFGRVHPSQRHYGQWDQMSEKERDLHRRDVADLMAASDIFVMGSAHEGLPVAIMEAFAAGLPVVATTVGGVPQQVREGVEGMLAPPKNPEALARALVAVAETDELRARMAEAAGERASAYDIRAAMKEQEQAYSDFGRR